jgi:hypothetical protein
MTASRSKASFVRRRRPETRTNKIFVPLNDEEFAIVQAEAEALGLSVEDYLLMCALDAGRAEGNA